jgi:hypothetical protein
MNPDDVIRPRRVQGEPHYQLSQRERDQTGRNLAYGEPEFLVRLVSWHRGARPRVADRPEEEQT